MTDHKQQLQSQLWNIANDLRGNMGADEFRDYILGFIFFKYLSEKVQLWADKQLKSDGITFIDLITHTKREDYLEGLAEESVGALGFFLKPHQLFSVLASRGGEHSEGHDTLIQDVEEAFRDIEQSVAGAESSDDFDGLFNEIDLYSTKLGKDKPQRSKLIGKVLIHLNKIDFQLENTEIDVLGDAYEYLISQFASGAGKKAGEFYTPQEVSSILSKIVTTGKDRLESVYDPTCGSGSLLLRVAKEVEKVGMFYGQEMNPTTYNLARMNMILHDVSYRYFDIKQDDTLERPQHDSQLFEAIVANPPFSVSWNGDNLKMDDPRFGMYGKLAPSSKADYAFVAHMLYHLKEDGVMAIVLPHGALSRGASEAHIRKHLVKELNWLDAVIGLPPNIFFGTGIPTCIMVFKKNRLLSDKVLFIDASNGFEKLKNKNYLKETDINTIVDTYRSKEMIEGFSNCVSVDEIADNNYILNISRYVNKLIEESIIDVPKLLANISDNHRRHIEIDNQIRVFCEELNAPFVETYSISLLNSFKASLMQRIFNKDYRFKLSDGNDFPKWNLIELSQVVDYEQPTKYIVDSTDYSDDNSIPVLTAGKSFILGYTDETHSTFQNLPVIIFDDFTTDFKYVDFEFKVKSSAMKILKSRNDFDTRYVYEAMKTINFPKGEHKRYWISEYQHMSIPCPILAEQKKIAELAKLLDEKAALLV